MQTHHDRREGQTTQSSAQGTLTKKDREEISDEKGIKSDSLSCVYISRLGKVRLSLSLGVCCGRIRCLQNIALAFCSGG